MRVALLVLYSLMLATLCGCGNMFRTSMNLDSYEQAQLDAEEAEVERELEKLSAPSFRRAVERVWGRHLKFIARSIHHNPNNVPFVPDISCWRVTGKFTADSPVVRSRSGEPGDVVTVSGNSISFELHGGGSDTQDAFHMSILGSEFEVTGTMDDCSGNRKDFRLDHRDFYPGPDEPKTRHGIMTEAVPFNTNGDRHYDMLVKVHAGNNGLKPAPSLGH